MKKIKKKNLWLIRTFDSGMKQYYCKCDFIYGSALALPIYKYCPMCGNKKINVDKDID